MATSRSALFRQQSDAPYTKERCKLDPLVVVAALFHGEHPCDRCNAGGDRTECGGTPRSTKDFEIKGAM